MSLTLTWEPAEAPVFGRPHRIEGVAARVTLAALTAEFSVGPLTPLPTRLEPFVTRLGVHCYTEQGDRVLLPYVAAHELPDSAQQALLKALREHVQHVKSKFLPE